MALPSYVKTVMNEISVSECSVIRHEELGNNVYSITFKGYFKVPYNSVILRKHKVEILGLNDEINLTIRMM